MPNQPNNIMNPRERFCRIMDYQPVDQLPVLNFEPYEDDVLKRWRQEGMPEHSSPTKFFGMDAIDFLPLNFEPLPEFPRRVISENNEEIIETDAWGTTVRRLKSSPTMYYGHIDFPVKTPEDWRKYRERFDATTAGRLPADMGALASRLNSSSGPVGVMIYPAFFRIGFYAMGMERFLTAFYDMPDLIHDMFNHFTEFYLAILRRVLPGIRVDYAAFAEDLAYKTNPHISPAIYREFWLPHQNRVVAELKKHGVPIITLHSSGNLEALVPLLLDNGVNCICPMERMAGMDPVKIRKLFGRSLRMEGGLSKEALIGGPRCIDEELARLLPVIREGGFIPALDDVVPPEVPLENYRYFINALRKTLSR